MRATLLFALLLPLPAAAQLPPIKITVDPAAEPKPALRYELLPPGRERVTGNAAFHYMKAHMNRPPRDRDPKKAQEESQAFEKWLDTPVAGLPVPEVKAYLERYKAALREVEHGSRCKGCEWASAPVTGSEAIDVLLPNVQVHREIAAHLSLRIKLELAEKRYDDAARTLRTGLQYGKHIAEGPTLIQMLVGVAITNIFLARTDDFIAAPASPNLYWGLSSLPRPLIDPRPGLDGEDALNESFLPGLDDLRKGPVSADRAMDVVANAVKVLQAGGRDAPGVFAGRLGLATYAAMVQNEARQELLARGHKKDDVDAMPPVQAAFLNSFEKYRELADDHRKWFLMPPADAVPGLAKAGERAKKVKADAKNDAVLSVFLMVLPAVEKVHLSLVRTERRVAMLRAVEAVRLHMAVTKSLPQKLADVKLVPVPDDPITAKPFEYAVTDAGFTLLCPTSPGMLGQMIDSRVEVTVRKAEK
jgi:hypothetical protein